MEKFLMKCPVCGLVFEATSEDIQKAGFNGDRYVPCPTRYSDEDIAMGISKKRYCTGYPEYPTCRLPLEEKKS